MLRVNQLVGFGSRRGGGAPVEYTDDGDTVDTVNRTVYDFANITSTRQYAFIVFGGNFGIGGPTVLSIVIDPGGDNISMTELVDYSTNVGGDDEIGALYIADYNIVNKTVRVTLSASSGHGVITVLSLDNLQSMVPVDSGQATGTGVINLASVVNGGICIAGLSASGTQPTVWVGLDTVISDINPEDERHSVALEQNYDGASISTSGPSLRSWGVVALR